MEILMIVFGIMFLAFITAVGLYERKTKTDQVIRDLDRLHRKMVDIISADDFTIIGKGDGGYLIESGGLLYRFMTIVFSKYYHFRLDQYIKNTDVGKAKQGKGFMVDNVSIDAKTYYTTRRPLSEQQPSRIPESASYKYLKSLAENLETYIQHQKVKKSGPDIKDIPRQYRYDSFDHWA